MTSARQKAAWRRYNPDGYQRERAAIRARARALSRLADSHRVEYLFLLNEERAAEGLEPVRDGWGRPRGATGKAS